MRFVCRIFQVSKKMTDKTISLIKHIEYDYNPSNFIIEDNELFCFKNMDDNLNFIQYIIKNSKYVRYIKISRKSDNECPISVILDNKQETIIGYLDKNLNAHIGNKVFSLFLMINSYEKFGNGLDVNIFQPEFIAPIGTFNYRTHAKNDMLLISINYKQTLKYEPAVLSYHNCNTPIISKKDDEFYLKFRQNQKTINLDYPHILKNEIIQEIQLIHKEFKTKFDTFVDNIKNLPECYGLNFDGILFDFFIVFKQINNEWKMSLGYYLNIEKHSISSFTLLIKLDSEFFKDPLFEYFYINIESAIKEFLDIEIEFNVNSDIDDVITLLSTLEY